jgi:hypothetical protein
MQMKLDGEKWIETLNPGTLHRRSALSRQFNPTQHESILFLGFACQKVTVRRATRAKQITMSQLLAFATITLTSLVRF